MSADPRVLTTSGARVNQPRSAPLQGHLQSSDAGSSLDSLTFEDFANTASPAVARNLMLSHQRDSLANVNQRTFAQKVEIPVTLHFSQDRPGEALIAANAQAMSTPSLNSAGGRVQHDLTNSIVYKISADLVNLSPDASVGLKLSAIPGTIFPREGNGRDEHEGYNAIVLPGESRTGVQLHTAKTSSNQARLARRMLQSLQDNKVNIDEDVALHETSDDGVFFTINPDSKTAAKVRSLNYHPQENPDGTIIISNKIIGKKYADKRQISVIPRTNQLLLDMDDLQFIRAELGGEEVTEEHVAQDASSGFMDLSNLSLKASVIPDSSAPGNSVYDSEGASDQTLHARLTVHYAPFSAVAHQTGEAIANDIKAKITSTAGTRKH